MSLYRSLALAGAVVMVFVTGYGWAAAAPPAQSSLPADVLGATWELSALETAPGSVENTLGTGVTISFAADGTASGSAGCNTFRGSYTVGESSALTIGPLASTRKACEPAVNELETKYLAALESVASYSQDMPTHLALQSADGSVVLRFQRAAAAQLPATGAASSVVPALMFAAVLLALGTYARRRGDART